MLAVSWATKLSQVFEKFNMIKYFSKESIIAKAQYNRWLTVPAALAIHLSIGQVYSFSVFNEPLTRTLGITKSIGGDWKLTTLGWIFSLAILFLGLSAAFGGKWLERVGPRLAMFTAACFFGGGFLISALGIWLHQIWLIYFGYGVIGGIGLGLGYVSPVATMIKWFPDRRGMATGIAIMGFGGGAMIGAPLAVSLMKHFSTNTNTGITATFITMGLIYFLVMLLGAFTVRIPAADWNPQGWQEKIVNPMITNNNVHVDEAIKTPQFWLLWLILCLNVTAGIGVLGQASVMIQDIFHGKITTFEAAWFVTSLSLFNMIGRFAWSSISDFIGRKNIYYIFFLVGAIFYSLVPYFGHSNNIILFVACYAIILSMYGGGFATLPAYIADMFGCKFVGSIHGRILTAWSVAGVLGPVLVNYLREYQILHGVAKSDTYNTTMYIMAGLLLIGAIANYLNRPVDPKHHIISNQNCR